jgi:two-component system sensor histidine kinase AlgZ
VRDDPALAERTILRLSDILRYALDSSQRATVRLARELEVVEDYLEIQKARFGARLCFELTIEAGVGDLPIAPFLILPLVENAVLHGVTRRQGATLRVSVTTRQAKLEVRVDDDGPGPGRSTHRGTGTSLVDLGHRVRLAYGNRASFETSENEVGGFCARLRLPLATGVA